MKRSFVLVAMALLLIGSLAFGEKGVLIDFSNLEPDIVADENGNPTVHSRTSMDFSKISSIPFDDAQKALMRSSLALHDWEIQMNSSARIVANMQRSAIKTAPVVNGPFAGKNVMGVRIVFPTAPVNANARIVPAFDIPAFEPMADIDEKGQVVEGSQKPNMFRFRKNGDDPAGYGVLDNVGAIKSVALTTYGYNYPHSVYVLLKDNDGVERRYYMGTLNFDGWKNLIWNNPDYVHDIRDREIKVYPLYPRGLPYAKLSGLYITRDAAHDGGDFIAYFKQIEVIYDKAVAQTERDIADEDLWGIVTAKEQYRQSLEMKRYGTKQVNRFVEKSNLAKEEGFSPMVTADNAQDQQ